MHAVTCFIPHTPSEQQVTVKLTHHQLQAGSRLKGLSTVIIAISKEAAAASGTRLLAFTTFSASKCRCPVSTLLYIQKTGRKEGGSSVSHSEEVYDSKGLDSVQVLKQRGLEVVSFHDSLERASQICTWQ